MCTTRGETVQHIKFECEKLAQKEYKRRHDNVAKKLHWGLCRKNGFKCGNKWYEHKPESIGGNNNVKLLWDFNIQCDNIIEARRPDIAILNKIDKSCIIVDVSVPEDSRIKNEEKEKIEKYQGPRRELCQIWQLKKAKVVPIFIGAFKAISKDFENYMNMLKMRTEVGVL